MSWVKNCIAFNGVSCKSELHIEIEPFLPPTSTKPVLVLETTSVTEMNFCGAR